MIEKQPEEMTEVELAEYYYAHRNGPGMVGEQVEYVPPRAARVAVRLSFEEEDRNRQAAQPSRRSSDIQESVLISANPGGRQHQRRARRRIYPGPALKPAAPIATVMRWRILANCATVILELVRLTRRSDTLVTWCASAQHVASVPFSSVGSMRSANDLCASPSSRVNGTTSMLGYSSGNNS
jgi:hypothetical protein